MTEQLKALNPQHSKIRNQLATRRERSRLVEKCEASRRVLHIPRRCRGESQRIESSDGLQELNVLHHQAPAVDFSEHLAGFEEVSSIARLGVDAGAVLGVGCVR